MKLFRKTRLLIKNIRLWYPILKEDQQWDYVYLYEIIQHKLKLMENLQRNQGNSVDAEVYADEMREVIDVLERLIEDDYMPEESKEYFKKLRIEDLFDNKRERSEEEHQEHLEWYRQEEKNRNKDIEFVFDTMKEKIERWWD